MSNILDIFVISREAYPSQQYVILYDILGVEEYFEDCEVHYRKDSIKQDILDKFKELSVVDQVTILGLSKEDSFYSRCLDVRPDNEGYYDQIREESIKQDKKDYAIIGELFKGYRTDQFESFGDQDSVREILDEGTQGWN